MPFPCPKRNFVLTVLAIIHLSIISIFIWTDTVYQHPDTIGRWISLYMNYVGSNRDYSFFAPSVANSLQAVCVVKDTNNVAQVYKIGTSDYEASFQFDCMISACMRKEAGMDMFSQSWATFYLSHHPQATNATIVSQSYEIPTMQDYRKGQKPHWNTIYKGTFQRKPTSHQ